MSLSDMAAQGPPAPEPTIPTPEAEGGHDGGEFKNVITTNALAPTEYKDAFAVIWELTRLNPED